MLDVDAIEKLYLERSDALDASSYSVDELCREVRRLREEVEQIRNQRDLLLDEVCAGEPAAYELKHRAIRYITVQVNKQTWLKWRKMWEEQREKWRKAWEEQQK